MRRLRDRRRRGYRCAVVEVGKRDATALVRAGYLDQHRAEDMTAIEAAIGTVLNRIADCHP